MPPTSTSKSLVMFLALVLCALATPVAAAEPSRDINTYVLFAYDEMILKGASGAGDRGHIRGGNIGVNFPTSVPGAFALSYATSARLTMDDPGTQAVADSVRCDNPLGVFQDLFANTVNASFHGTIVGQGPLPFTPPIIAAANLPVFPFTPGRALTDGASDVTVGGTGLPSPQTVASGAYRDVRINNGGEVTFGDGVFDLRSLSFGTNVTVHVTNGTILQIDRGLSVNDGLKLGLGTQSGARIYLGAFGFNPSANPVTNFSHNAEIHAQIFSPFGWIDVGGRNQLFGRIWAKRITGDPNNNFTFEGPSEHPPLETDPRRFQCYEIHRPVMNLGVSLVDALGASTVTVQRAKRICAPADVDGSDPAAPLAPGHLTYYTIDQTSPFAPVKNVQVSDQFGTVSLRLSTPDRMLVPTAKSVSGAPAPLATAIDHYKCYRVAGAQFHQSDIDITDQFGSIEVDIKRPLHLCLTADKNGEGIVTPGAALMCYSVRGVPPSTAPALVYTDNQFGPDQFPFFGPRDLCVPATVVLPPLP